MSLMYGEPITMKAAVQWARSAYEGDAGQNEFEGDYCRGHL